ncbi:MAG: hypothetical protein ACN2B6_11795 [Rickettsiales bacterium]
MKSIFAIVFIIFSAKAYSCGDRTVPIEFNVKRGHYGDLYINIKAPLDYEQFYLGGAQYNKGENQIPMYMGYQGEKGFAIYMLNGEDSFFNGAEVSISYKVKNTLCLHVEKYTWENILEACVNCEKKPNKSKQQGPSAGTH